MVEQQLPSICHLLVHDRGTYKRDLLSDIRDLGAECQRMKVCDIRWGLTIKRLESNQQGLKLNSKMNREAMKGGQDCSDVLALLVPVNIPAGAFWTIWRQLNEDWGRSTFRELQQNQFVCQDFLHVSPHMGSGD